MRRECMYLLLLPNLVLERVGNLRQPIDFIQVSHGIVQCCLPS